MVICRGEKFFAPMGTAILFSNSRPPNIIMSMNATISSHDRLHFCLFLASVVHAILIFGVGFSQPQGLANRQSLEVTLALHRSEKAPDQADFLAQANQTGSGSVDEKALPSTTELADFRANEINEIQPMERASLQDPQIADKAVINTLQESLLKSKTTQKSDTALKRKLEHDESLSLMQRSLEIASLEAQLRERQQMYAKRPRKRQLTSASTKEARDAAYLDAWRTKIEITGNSEYARLGVNNMYGNLSLLVSVKANGTVHRVKVLRSSGYKALDDAAIRVVRMAAPFDPFPEAIRKDTDILEIIRTWKFEKGHYLSSSWN